MYRNIYFKNVQHLFMYYYFFLECDKTTWWPCDNIHLQWNLYLLYSYASFSCTYCLFHLVPKTFQYKQCMIISDVLFLKVSAIQNSWSGPTIFAELLLLRKNNESNVMFLECTVAVARPILVFTICLWNVTTHQLSLIVGWMVVVGGGEVWRGLLVNLRAMLCSSYCCIGSNNHLVCFALLGSAFNSCMI